MSDFRGWHGRGYLPHLDAPGIVQAITFRLADSLPVEAVAKLKTELPEEKHHAAIDALLDAGHGSCLLRDPNVAETVEKALLHFHGTRYHLLAWVVMPNHVHLVLQPGVPLPDIVHSWKSFTAKRLGGGRLWQPDYFDRRIRDEHHFAAAVRYAEDNPVKAGLVAEAAEWRWSSARLGLGYTFLERGRLAKF